MKRFASLFFAAVLGSICTLTAVEVLDKDDKESLEEAAKALSDKIMPIGAKMYEAASKEEKPSEDGDKAESKKKDDRDDPVEGEVVDEK